MGGMFGMAGFLAAGYSPWAFAAPRMLAVRPDGRYGYAINSQVLELLPGGQAMLLRAGVGWKDGTVGNVTVPADPTTQPGFTLTAGEPVVVELF